MFHLSRFLLALSFAIPYAHDVASAEFGRETGLPVPRYVSLRAENVNARSGPGRRYPIKWVYQRRNLPVEVVAEFDTWRKVRDFEGQVGWVHRGMLSGRRTVVVVGDTPILRSEPNDWAEAVAYVERGVLGELDDCRQSWCEVRILDHSGWLRRSELWGIGAGESIDE